MKVIRVSQGPVKTAKVLPCPARSVEKAQTASIHFDGAKVYTDTTENWGRKTDYVPDVGDIIVYTDKDTVDVGGDTVLVPGVKIGDGNAYVVDLPFIDDALAARLAEHIDDDAIHVSAEDREFWNSQLDCEVEDEELIFTRG